MPYHCCVSMSSPYRYAASASPVGVAPCPGPFSAGSYPTGATEHCGPHCGLSQQFSWRQSLAALLAPTWWIALLTPGA
jgi:hypothetical protein